MKFSEYFHMRGVRTVSAALGLLIGSTFALLSDWRYGVLAGAVVALVASFVLPFRMYLSDRPYAKLKKTIAAPFLLDERVRFTVKDGTVGGFFLLTAKSMIFLSLERGNHRLELSREDVKSVVLGENMTISIFLNEKQYIRLIAGDCEGIYEILRDNGWSTVG
ncbi:MAG: hypothetical protein IKA05_01765 [Clostridia bacterium]|nr:hypothetical protein [Clostridia bacterium]